MFANKRSEIPDDRDSKLVQQKLENHPEGYPRIAAYLNSSNDTALFRRFGDLRMRSLLYKEVELTELEEDLAKLDRDDNSKGETEWRIGNAIHHDTGGQNEDRKILMEKIDKKLEVYDNMLLRDSRIRKLPRPSQRVHRNFMDFIYTETPFEEREQNFIFHEHDFVSLQEYEDDSWLDALLHRFMGHCRTGILRYIFVSPKDRAKTVDPYLHYYSTERLGALIKIIIAIASTTLLLIPIFLFLALNLSTRLMAAVVLIFAFAFATAISFFTSAKRQDVFAATAAYCAVLVVFVGNIQQRQLSSVA